MILANTLHRSSYILIAIIFGASHASAITDRILVGSCPSKIILEPGGEWTGAYNRIETLRAYLTDIGIKSDELAAFYMVDDDSMLQVTVRSLPSLERFQGAFDEDDFDAIRTELYEVFQGPSPEMIEKIDDFIVDNLSATEITVEHLGYEPAVSSPGKFIGYAISEMEIPDMGKTLHQTAMKIQLIRGCVVQANFAIVISSGSRSRLDNAISDFVMR